MPESSKKKDRRRSSRLPAGTAGLLSTLGEKGRGFDIKPIVIVILSILLIAGSIIILIV
ncbi:MAG: hypothetical protein ACUVQ0_00130 [Thermoproteota archaeon]